MRHFPSEPFHQSLRPYKQTAKRHYGSHPYFTKRAWNVVQEYIKHFSRAGDLVLDPFGGSGVTAVEPLVLRRRAAYLDISPWACFLARETALAPVNLAKLGDAFLEVEQRCRKPIEELGRRADADLKAEPVPFWYPRGVRLPDNADVSLVEELFTPRMLHGLSLLKHAIDEVEESEARELLLLAFSSTLVRINRTFLSAVSRTESRGGSAIFSLYRYKVAAQTVELPLWPQFRQRFQKLVQAKHETNLLIGDYFRDGDTATFTHGSATELHRWLEPESVDYIYTDPPYGAHISYLDLSTMWCAWLKLNVSRGDRANEVIEGGQLRKSRSEYQALLSHSVAEMAKALKPGAWLSLVFAHRDTSYWETIVQACEDAGLGYANTVVQPVGVVWSMHKKKNPLRVLSGELVLNFRKGARPKALRPVRPGTSAETVVLECCADRIVQGYGATTEDMHHAVIPRLLEAGLLSEFSRGHGDIAPLLEKAFDYDSETGRWHLRSADGCLHFLKSEDVLRYFARRFVSKGSGGAVARVQDFIAYLGAMGFEPRTFSHRDAESRLRESYRMRGRGEGSTEMQEGLFESRETSNALVKRRGPRASRA